MANRTKLTDDARARFLDVLRETGNVTSAARAVNISRTCAYDHRNRFKRFQAAWDEALAEACDVLEAEARRRAVEGYERPIYQRGALVGHVTEYSDTLLIALLKAHNPIFRERGALDLNVPNLPDVVVKHRSDDPDRISEILGILAGAGALSPNGEPEEASGASNPEADPVHPP